jgi:hypothetical protein
VDDLAVNYQLEGCIMSIGFRMTTVRGSTLVCHEWTMKIKPQKPTNDNFADYHGEFELANFT